MKFKQLQLRRDGQPHAVERWGESTVNQKNSGATLNKFAYAYDTRDVRTGVQQQYGSDPLRQVNYTYDSVDQLKSEAASGGVANTNYSNAFDYDAMGNRTKSDTTQGSNSSSVRSSVNALNQVTALSSSLNGGPRVTSGFDYDTAGNTTSITGSDGSKTLFSYDDADRLVRIETRNAADAPLSKSEFVYDYASRKAVSREFTYSNGAWQQTDEKRRVFDGLDVVQERNAQNEVTAQLVRDGNIGGILARSTAAGASFFGYDGGGNVTLLTDENGDDVGRYRYDAFGNTLEVSGSRAAENPYRFSTKGLHAASGLYDFGFRFYSAGLGKWINRDPISESGGLNLYAMVGNDPVNSVDVYGLARVTVVYWWLFGDERANFKSSHGAGAYHAYIIVSENDDSNPYIFHGWHEGNWNWKGKGKGLYRSYGPNGFLTIDSGKFCAAANWPEYESYGWSPKQVVVNGDKHPASYYRKAFTRIKDAYNRDRVLYDYTGPNSNTAVHDMLKLGVRGPIPRPLPEVTVPGWNSTIWQPGYAYQ